MKRTAIRTFTLVAATLTGLASGMHAQDAIFVAPDGKVGLGTTTPETRLHVFGPASEDVFASFGPSPDFGPALNFGYAGGSFGAGVGFLNVRPLPGGDPNNQRPALYFMTNNLARIVIDKDGQIGFGSNVDGFNPDVPLKHRDTGARLEGGTWTNGSSRTIKHDIRELSAADARAAFEALAPVRYRPNSKPDEELLGFIAEDVPDLVAFNDRTGLSPMEFVAVLTKVMQEQARVIETQQETLNALVARIERLEKNDGR